jgi:hypothetical protein
MKIFEIADSQIPDPNKLLGLVDFLAGRATDTNAQKEISQEAFIKLANHLNIPVTKFNLPDLTNQEPLSRVLEPLQPNSNNPVVFKGGNPTDISMPVNQAQDIVAAAAKSAARKDRSL